MALIDRIYIDGAFVEPHGREVFDLYNPATTRLIGQVRLADRDDTRRAIAAARRAFPAFSRTSKAERIAMLHRLRDAVAARRDDIVAAMVEEFGSPVYRIGGIIDFGAELFTVMAGVLDDYQFTRRVGAADVVMEPVGVAAQIMPWNSTPLFICAKLSASIAAGCTVVMKPSEMSAKQTQVMTEALHAAGLPPGVFNIVTGRGDVVGDELSKHPDIAKVSFTGSTVVGKQIVRNGAETCKRVTLELGGKSPVLILDDADFEQAVTMAVHAGFMNNGEACTAGTRMLVPVARLQEVEHLARAAVASFRLGDPGDPATTLGPLVSQKQWERVQNYIRQGIAEGARLIVGGEGRPDGLAGWFVRPTVFSHVRNDMTIAREEIFGPVLSIITYRDEDEAVAIANDTIYGLQAFVFSSDVAHARNIAARIVAGRVTINSLAGDALAPFGGFKQSGIGRELGVAGLEAYLEPKSIYGAAA